MRHVELSDLLEEVLTLVWHFPPGEVGTHEHRFVGPKLAQCHTLASPINLSGHTRWHDNVLVRVVRVKDTIAIHGSDKFELTRELRKAFAEVTHGVRVAAEIATHVAIGFLPGGTSKSVVLEVWPRHEVRRAFDQAVLPAS